MQKQLLDLTKEEIAMIQPNRCININLGVLGHVDSGKTSICRILSQVTSTASLDKNPQSQQRGITLDLGFSAFFTRLPTHLTHTNPPPKQQYLQFTLVDCPGHASLLKTIIGGAQIIDLMFLIIDITKGIQAQTAECVIIAELFMRKMVVVLNKVDMVEDQKVMTAKIAALRKVFGKTKFGAEVLMVPFSAKTQTEMHNRRLKQILLQQIQLPKRNYDNKFLYLIDHCFKIKGKGTILTGTVLQGRIKPGQQIQLCELQQKSKIKSMQMFRKPIQIAKQGDRVAMLMHHLQADLVERGIGCTPGALRRGRRVVVDLNIVRLYKRAIKNKARFNVMSGHQTVEGELRLFIAEEGKIQAKGAYMAIGELDQQMLKQAKEQQEGQPSKFFAVITFEKQFYCNLDTLIIGYKPDIDNDEKACRIAFSGHIRLILEKEGQQQLKLFKKKNKNGEIDRIVDGYSIIVKGLFDKETNLENFIGKEIVIGDKGLKGKIQGGFGKSGKIKVIVKEGIEGKVAEGDPVAMEYTKWYH